ncbi:MAG: phosphoribosyltransferase family protein [bacterium]|nr:phosphoribosyltransferase family protein [bacterium]
MRTILEKVKKIGKGVANVLFPAFCASCGKEGAYICKNCELFLGEVPLICPVCNVSSFGGTRHVYCESSRYGLEGLASMWEYEGIVKHLLGQVKYVGITHVVEELVRRAFANMAKDQQRFASFLSFLFEENTVVTYVPIFLRREKRRGFNQAQLIARAVGKVADKKVLSLLRKTRNTESQTDLDKEQRLQNVKDAFVMNVKGQMSNVKIPERVVLVDDIWTTGATMKECCKELKKAGVEKVWGFTLARTV